MSGRPGRAPSRIEIQIHPSDIRGRVRYLFLQPRQVAFAVLGVLAYLAFVAFAMILTPDVVTGLLSREHHRQLLLERKSQGERIEAMLGRLRKVQGQGEDLRLRLSKIFLAYGLSTEESIGQGGYPFEPQPVPSSVYARLIEEGNALTAELHEESHVLATFLDEVHSFEEAHVEQAQTTPSVSPLRGDTFVLTSPFGNRRSPFTKQIDFHAGVDLAASVGTPVYAPADGTVNYAGRYPLKQSVAWWRYGNLVVLRHNERFVTLFGHLEDIEVRRGARVQQGDRIGTVGNTGWSTSPHLHYEVRRRDEEGEMRPVDPRIYILDHRWRDEERFLVRARSAPDLRNFEPLPRLLAR